MKNMLSIMTPTRKRPQMLLKMIKSLSDNMTIPEEAEHLIYIDEDDEETIALAENGSLQKAARYEIIPHILPRPKKLPDTMNTLWKTARGEFLIAMSDDYEIRTPNWDLLIKKALSRHEDGFNIAYIPDQTAPGLLTVLCGTANFFQELGYFVNPHFVFWFSDSWLDEISHMVMRRETVDINMGPQGGERGKTNNLRDLKFWHSFFHETRPDRQEEAERIRNIIYKNDPAMRQISKDHEKELVELWNERFKNANTAIFDDIERDICETGNSSPDYAEALAAAKRHLETLRVK